MRWSTARSEQSRRSIDYVQNTLPPSLPTKTPAFTRRADKWRRIAGPERSRRGIRGHRAISPSLSWTWLCSSFSSAATLTRVGWPPPPSPQRRGCCTVTGLNPPQPFADYALQKMLTMATGTGGGGSSDRFEGSTNRWIVRLQSALTMPRRLYVAE